MSPATVMRAAARAATQNSVSRPRTLSIAMVPFVHDPQRVTGAPPGLNELDRLPVVDLPAQALDVDLDQVRHRIEAVVPDMFGDVGPADDVTLATEQVFE